MASLCQVGYLVDIHVHVCTDPDCPCQVVDLVVQETDDENKLRQELRETHAELSKLNLMDEFAKYARTERKLNKLKEELSKHSEITLSIWAPFLIFGV